MARRNSSSFSEYAKFAGIVGGMILAIFVVKHFADKGKRVAVPTDDASKIAIKNSVFSQTPMVTSEG